MQVQAAALQGRAAQLQAEADAAAEVCLCKCFCSFCRCLNPPRHAVTVLDLSWRVWCAQRLLEARAAGADAAAELRRVTMEIDARAADLSELDQLHEASAAELAKLGRQHEAVSALQKRLLDEERDTAQAAHAQRCRGWQTGFEEERRQAERVLADLHRRAQASTPRFIANVEIFAGLLP